VSSVAQTTCNDDAASSTDNTSASVLNTMPYRLTEQFVIKVQKDDAPAVWFYSVLSVDVLFINSARFQVFFCD